MFVSGIEKDSGHWCMVLELVMEFPVAHSMGSQPVILTRRLQIVRHSSLPPAPPLLFQRNEKSGRSITNTTRSFFSGCYGAENAQHGERFFCEISLRLDPAWCFQMWCHVVRTRLLDFSVLCCLQTSLHFGVRLFLRDDGGEIPKFI